MSQRSLTRGFFQSFDDLIRGDSVYIDKTAPICELAMECGAFLLTRPRRMGKSTLISTLEYLFSKGTEGTEGLACHEQWNEPYRYFVVRLAWNEIDAKTSNDFKYFFINNLKRYVDFFGLSIDTELDVGTIFETLVRDILSKLADESFLEQHPDLSQGDRPLNTKKIVLLIDEYDAPLTDALENEQSVEELRGAYREIFSSLKALSCFRFVFITGVTSYAQTSIFSGANQFVDISLLDDYATCCGYTHEDLERYMQPELEHAQEVLKLNHDELMYRLTYHYNGYLFSRDNDEAKRVFSPVSVSRFLYEPEYGFQRYWSNTGGASPFVYKMLKLCNQELTKALVKLLLPQTASSELQQDASRLEDFISKWFPILTSASVSQNLDASEASLLTSKVDSLVMKIDEGKELSSNDAIAVLYQSGYLSIKKVKGKKVYLGIANHEVLMSLCKLMAEKSENVSIESNLVKFRKQSREVFADIQQGGKELSERIGGIFNTAPWELFDKDNYENVVTYIIYLALHFYGIRVSREVSFVFGRADLVIYKPETNVLIPDVVIEFKLAKEAESVTNKLKLGCDQLIAKKYGICPENLNPKRYCIVISNELRGVGAIARVDANDAITIEYQSDLLDAHGKVQSKPRNV